MIGLISAMIGGVLAAVLALMLGLSGDVAVWVGLGGAVVTFVAILAFSAGRVPRQQAELTVLFPAPEDRR